MDILHRRLAPKSQAIVELVCSLIFMFPILALMIYVSGQWAIHSWASGETWIVSIWKPPLAPSRTMILVGFVLFMLQGIANFIRSSHFVVTGERL
jgi:TRAP-type mannitol/chloroaromatic compound transport system permease small subunit